MSREPYKVCSCGARWSDRDAFLFDPAVELIGYACNFRRLRLGWFYFNHHACGTTTAVVVHDFTDLVPGPVFSGRQTGTPSCPGHCLRTRSLAPCPAECECAWVRDVIQVVRVRGARVAPDADGQ